MQSEEWLTNKFVIPNTIEKSTKVTVGRPSKSFGESSERSQREKCKILSESLILSEIKCVAKSKLWSKGKRIATKKVGDILDTPDQAPTIKKALIKSESKMSFAISPNKALAFILDNNLTKH